MCLAIPTRIKTIDGTLAEVEIGGIKREVSLMLTPEAIPGDYVLVHTGYAISIVDEADALETLRLFDELVVTERE